MADTITFSPPDLAAALVALAEIGRAKRARAEANAVSALQYRARYAELMGGNDDADPLSVHLHGRSVALESLDGFAKSCERRAINNNAEADAIERVLREFAR